METTIYSEDSRLRIQNRIASAVKTKLISNGVENADELSVKFTQMMAQGHSKEEVLSELEKCSKVDENKSLEQIEKHNKSFVDWLFGYSSVVVPLNSTITHDNDTPLTEADTETTNENQSASVSALPIDDIDDDDDDDEKEKNDDFSTDDEDATEQGGNHEIKNELLAEVLANEDNDDNDDFDVVDNIEEETTDESDDIPELQSRDSDLEQTESKVLESKQPTEKQIESEPKNEEAKVSIKITEEKKEKEQEKVQKVEEKKEQKHKEEKEKEVEVKKPEVPKRRSFIRIKEGKSGRFTPIKSEDRHSFVKRNLTHVATQLDEASKVQKKMMSHAVAVANASENLTLSRKKSSASISSASLEKKKSFRRDSINSNSSTPSVYSSTNATFINSFANKTFPKVNKTNVNTSSVTPDKAVRCSYWPNCNRGEECKFWHPKEICPNLNNCTDGDQCLYIHPVIPQNQLNKNKNKKKSELNLEINDKHSLQKKISKRDSSLSLSGSSQSNLKKNLKNSNKEATNTAAANNYAIECKYGANCTRPDCKFSHPSPAAILAAKKKAENIGLKKKESGRLKEKKSHDILKHKESRSSNKLSNASQVNENKKNANSSITEETQTILCRYGSDCKRAGCKFKHI